MVETCTDIGQRLASFDAEVEHRVFPAPWFAGEARCSLKTGPDMNDSSHCPEFNMSQCKDLRAAFADLRRSLRWFEQWFQSEQ